MDIMDCRAIRLYESVCGYLNSLTRVVNNRKIFNRLLLTPVFFIMLSVAQADQQAARYYEDALASAQQAYQTSQYAKARAVLNEAGLYLDNETEDQYTDVRLGFADLYLSLGLKLQAIKILQTALSGIENTSSVTAVLIHDRLGVAYKSAGDYRQASQHLKAGAEIANQLENDEISAIVLNDLGGLYIVYEELALAEKHFRNAYSAAQKTNKLNLIIRSGINLARVSIKRQHKKGLANLLDSILVQINKLPNTDSARLDSYLNIGDLYRSAQIRFALNERWRSQAYEIFNAAHALALKQNNQRGVSYALGYLGQLYEDENRIKEALQYTRKAGFSAQQADDKESLYRWTWQSARLLRKSGDIKKAISTYKQAIELLAEIKHDLVLASPDAYRRRVAPLYIEYADLLLAESDKSNHKQTQQYLREIRDTLEYAKVAEMADYFQSECLQQVAETKQLDVMSQGSAIIYPVLLKDRIEILVTLPDGMMRYKVNVGYKKLAQQVIALRKSLESYQKGVDYKKSAQQLYTWLIKPVEADLQKQGIKTLVFVPDGPLRSIPMSILFDGKKFLVEKYAIATTPSLFLTDPKPIERDKVQILIGGLTQSVQGFPALPNVDNEIKKINQMYPATVYKDEDFVLENIENEMAEGAYSIVHVATHAQFDRDHEKSFLLAYDDKMTMDQIEQSIGVRKYTTAPLEMLVMSACQTAAGDDKAALGLAGVAVKAGARSALATLWFISDEATAELISEFYTQLKNTKLSKAQALRNAQLSLIKGKRYQHPSYWAPFLMIGNWL